MSLNQADNPFYIQKKPYIKSAKQNVLLFVLLKQYTFSIQVKYPGISQMCFVSVAQISGASLKEMPVYTD